MLSKGRKMHRAFWAFGYLLFLIAGIVAFFSPSQIIERTLVAILVYAWACFLAAGGVICLWGKLRGSWVGEIIGLPLLCAANFIFGVLILLEGTSPAAFAVGSIFCGIGAMLVARWMELRQLAKENQGVNSVD